MKKKKTAQLAYFKAAATLPIELAEIHFKAAATLPIELTEIHFKAAATLPIELAGLIKSPRIMTGFAANKMKHKDEKLHCILITNPIIYTLKHAALLLK